VGTKKPKEKYKFVFPNAMAKVMSKVNMRTQMESSMLSQGLLLIGLTIVAILMIWTSGDRSVFSTIMIVFNLCAAWLLMSSYLVTTYQQYTNYMEAAGYDPQAERAKVKASGNIFKRISNAKKAKKVKEEFKVPTLIGDAMLSKQVVDADKEEVLEFLEDKIKKQSKEQINTKELERRDNYGK